MRRVLLLLVGLVHLPLQASDVIDVRRLGADLAHEMVREAVHVCREKGYQVSAVVVDRSANIQSVMRDTLAARFTVEIAQRKANAVILSGVDSGSFRNNRDDIRAEMNQVGGILLLDGALPIEVAGSLLAAIGVSGAPGGDKDAECARVAVDKYRERLEFAQ
ncbi:MAG: heme-binding protein [Gammaproteobacteria bacterium]|nr:heme-binding protein [Gammaproteobacteria bacterium]